MHSTSARIDLATHERQDRVGADLRVPLREDAIAWLDADLG
jgi:hypothetical protein